MEQRTTMDDIALELGVSKTTVSRAISGKGRISEETRKAVIEYANKTGYRSNREDIDIAKKTYNIGVVLPSSQNVSEIPFFQKALVGICETASTADYNVLLVTADVNDISQLSKIVTDRKVDGVILTRTYRKDLSVSFLKGKIPYVVIGDAEDDDVLSINYDHETACSEMTNLLISQGIERPAFIGGNMDYMVNRSRYQGFLNALHRNVMEPTNGLLCFNAVNKLTVQNAVRGLVAKGTDCIFCMDDIVCNMVNDELTHQRIKIGKQIAVASFYDGSLLNSLNPSITALHFNDEELGIQGCKLLLDTISEKNLGSRLLTNYEIILRDSTRMCTIK